MPNILLLFKAVRLYIYSLSNFGKKSEALIKAQITIKVLAKIIIYLPCLKSS